ncbi:hypothetical protein JKP75_10945 [Blastococcus sp. TML/M2B]|uniref:hypothetical protein n=1 Tax=unclassified Blastococcus TaxID=2619396 RepID=UPI00190A754E|nr:MULTISPECIES: hypothetical protein [unclassified Blastococcus]MBN1093028.1 hypothetical protein [Blastococcus sp. TML/M2B]MBN1096857.1 hypothetical protein [Blastococcus sp. TML/C7B]
MTDPGTTDGATRTEGQTARDILPEADGIPETAQDDSPTMERAEDPQFEALPGESPTATTDFGTTAAEQAEGEPLDGRLDRELPDDSVDVRPAEDPQRGEVQLEQDLDTSDSGTDRTADDVDATGDAAIGGEGPEESAVHVTDA